MSVNEPAPDTAIVEAVRRELEIRRLVDQILAEQNEKKASSGFWKHPIVLLVITFIFTGILGSGLTSCWQNKQWAGEAKYRAAEQATKDRIDTINYATETIAAAFAAGDDVLHLYSWDWPQKSEVVTLKERAQHWGEQSRKWRVAERVLRARVKANFSDPEIGHLLGEITERRYELGNYVFNLLWSDDRQRSKLTGHTPKDMDDFRERSAAIVKSVTVGDAGHEATLQRMTRLMLAETERRRPNPKGGIVSLWSD
jgi:hypothetical protein